MYIVSHNTVENVLFMSIAEVTNFPPCLIAEVKLEESFPFTCLANISPVFPHPHNNVFLFYIRSILLFYSIFRATET